jgi:hypothetical protein
MWEKEEGVGLMSCEGALAVSGGWFSRMLSYNVGLFGSKEWRPLLLVGSSAFNRGHAL